MTARFVFVICLTGAAGCAGRPPPAPHDSTPSHFVVPRAERPTGAAARESPRDDSAAASSGGPAPAANAPPPKASEATLPSSMTKAPPATEPADVAPRGPVVPNAMPEPSPL